MKGNGPEAVGAPPGPTATDLVYLEAFWQCGRQVGFSGPQPLQPAQVAAWLDLRGFTDGDFRRAVWRVVSALDAVFMAHYARVAAKPSVPVAPGKLG